MTLSDAIERQQSPAARLGKLAELLERSGVDLDDVARVTKVKAWQGFMRDKNDEPQVVDMVGLEFVPTFADGPLWPVVAQAKPVNAKPRTRSANRGVDVKTIVICPDPQIGFRRYEDGTLDPFHDDRAIDLSLQIIRDAQPDRIINLGDTLDFPEWSSKFLVKPEFVLTTQPTVDRGHRFLAEQLTEAPTGCESDLMEGNHDNRLPNAIAKNAMAALRLRQANTPESWPVLSVQHLLRLDELGVTYHDGYPAGRVKLAAGVDEQTPLYAKHGEGTNMPVLAKRERQSFVQGHGHHIADHYETFELDGQRITVNAFTLGCLCRTDGAVPSTKGGDHARGNPVHRVEGWQQGLGVVTVHPDGSWAKEIVEIRTGRAIWRGKEYRA